ncbi:MAG TPA: SRPBCC family protein [Solirubrobacterales bacterium]|nr:SRPBCC family protein [Solirubrobacterales bacterium]
MASAETGAAVEVETRIAASPETVFDFFTDPDKMIQWMGRSAELDARPGGAFRCDINGRDVASGEYVELDPPHRVVFTWGWEGEDSVTQPGSSKIEILLEPDGDGTQLRLIHSDLPSAESAERHRHGWEHYTERLVAAAGGEGAGPDPWATPDSVS